MGVGHEFETFLRGVQRAAAAGVNAVVVFIGGGVRLPEVRSLVSSLGLSDLVIFKDFVPADVLPFSLGIADLAVVTLRSGFEGVIVPSKLLGYMARGIPVLYVGPDSDIAEMIRDTGCGTCCLPDSVAGVADALHRSIRDRALLRRWGENGRRCYAAHFTRDLALHQYVDVVREAFPSRGREPV
jgi:glycosyltransferase involved in cell wall biosynthesis